MYSNEYNNILLISLILGNVLLISSYVHLKASRHDFVNLTNKWLQNYLLLCAFVAYVCVNVFASRVFYRDDHYVIPTVASVVSFFALQFLFIPCIRAYRKNSSFRWMVVFLLALCVAPVATMMWIGVDIDDPLLITTGTVATVHALFNDLILFGSLF